MIGYINSSQHARCAEYDLDLESGKFTKIINKSIASDPSTGNMVQAFLKKATLDNWYQRVRILRYQSILDENGAGGDWTRQEKNLVKQNYLWASKKFNLHPTDGSIGYYITLQPVMNRADYDVHDTYLYTTYYFWMSAPHLVNESVSGLADSRLNPQFPGAYMNRDKNFDSFDSMVDKGLSTDVSWTKSNLRYRSELT